MLAEDRLDALLTSDLAGVRRPGILPGDETLEPLLVAASAFGGLREARPTPAFADALEAGLLARIASAGASATLTAPASARANEPPVSLDAPAPVAPIALPRLPARHASSRTERHTSQRMSRRPRFLWPAVAAAVLLLAFGTLTVAAAAAGPGSLLYGLHRMEQGVRVAFAGNPADRMRLHLGYASDALNAANAAAHSGNAAAYGDALGTLRSELDAATSELANVPSGTEHDSLAGQLDALRGRAAANLRADLPPLSWSERIATTDALADLGSAVPRVTGATAQREQNPATHTWHVVLTGTGFAPGAVLLVNGQPAGSVVSVSPTTLVAEYTASDGQPPDALGVANPDDTGAQTSRVTLIPPGQGTPSGPATTPGAGGNHGNGSGSGSGKGGHGGDHPPTPTPGG